MKKKIIALKKYRLFLSNQEVTELFLNQNSEAINEKIYKISSVELKHFCLKSLIISQYANDKV